MRRSIKLLSIVAACSIAAAHAQEGDPEEGSGGALVPYIEVIGFAGYRMGGNFDVDTTDLDADLDDHSSFALAFDIARDDVLAVRALLQLAGFAARAGFADRADRRESRVPADRRYAGRQRPARSSRPYITAGLGVTRFSPDPPGTDDSTHFSLSLGGGLRFPLNQRFSLRLEARGHLTFLDTDTALFCASGAFGGVCALQGNGSTFIQYELLAGAAFAF